MAKKVDIFNTFIESKPIKILGILAGILVFIITILPEVTNKWKDRLMESFNILPNEENIEFEEDYIIEKKNNLGKDVIYIELPVFFKNEDTTETVNLTRLIALKTIALIIEKSNNTEFANTKADSINPKTYFDVEQFLDSYIPTQSINLKVEIDKNNIRPKYKFSKSKLSEYLYITFKQSNDSTFRDVIKTDYINFDRNTKNKIIFDSLFVNSFIQVYAEKNYTEMFLNKGIKNHFKNGIFYLPNNLNFILNENSLDIYYYKDIHISDSFVLKIPYSSIDRSIINPKNKLSFLFNRPKKN